MLAKLHSERWLMNTRMNYHYADQRDCRQFVSIVLAGTITWDEIEPFLSEHTSFIPGQLGLEDLQHRFALPGVDHSWHHMAASDLTPTESEPTVTVTGKELAKRFADTPWESGWFANGYSLLPPIKAAWKAFDMPVPPTPSSRMSPKRAEAARTRALYARKTN
jgi:hypothetical protein